MPTRCRHTQAAGSQATGRADAEQAVSRLCRIALLLGAPARRHADVHVVFRLIIHLHKRGRQICQTGTRNAGWHTYGQCCLQLMLSDCTCQASEGGGQLQCRSICTNLCPGPSTNCAVVRTAGGAPPWRGGSRGSPPCPTGSPPAAGPAAAPPAPPSAPDTASPTQSYGQSSQGKARRSVRSVRSHSLLLRRQFLILLHLHDRGLMTANNGVR